MNNIVLGKEITYLQLRTEFFHKLHCENTTIISVLIVKNNKNQIKNIELISVIYSNINDKIKYLRITMRRNK
jgi:hypothetical protein